ncbi:MAG TPA: cation diffusion facilitator family transporter [Rhodospirillaceae bacterium]|nr:cation diffusion facilitator family transporter [Rhodospirillaceae bacterium]
MTDARLMRLATYCAVAVALVLIVAKLGAWVATDSVALLSTLIDSTMDAVASLINVAAVHHALQPADREHRFGHGKAEPLAGLGQSAFIAGSALFLVGEAGKRLFRPEQVTNVETGIAVMVFSVLLTAVLVTFQTRVVRRTGSLAIGADHLHYLGDLLMNASVVVSLLLGNYLGWTFADPLFAIAIAGLLLHGAWTIALRSYNLLMDKEFPDEERRRILDICRTHPEVLSVHDLRTRSAGLQSFIQLHLELAADISLAAAHVISDEVEAKIRDAFPVADIIIHQDPAGIYEPPPPVD